MIFLTAFDKRRRSVISFYALVFCLNCGPVHLMAETAEVEDVPSAKAQGETESQSEFDVDDYLGGTEVYETQERRKFQFESNFLLGNDLFSFRGGLEYGITDQLMIAAEAGYFHSRGEKEGEEEVGEVDDSPISSTYEVEVRYRLISQKSWPVDIAFAIGANAEVLRSGQVLWAAEPRLILQRTVGRFAATANFSGDLGRGFSTEVSGGIRYEICKYAVVACEILYDFQEREALCIPQIFIAPADGLTLQFGYGFSNEPDAGNNFIAGVLLEF